MLGGPLRDKSGIELFRLLILAMLHRNAAHSWSPFLGSRVPFSVLFAALWCSMNAIGKCLSRNELSSI
jgi:hypothetical protein